jgi:hypothetical protein
VNGLGIAGFVVSLVGVVATCGLLAPLGLALSTLAMLRPRRGLATAGMILGLIGTTWVVMGGLAVKAGVDEAKDAVRHEQTTEALAHAAHRIEVQRDGDGTPPDEPTGRMELVDVVDGYGNGVYYTRLGERDYELRSGGRDGEFFTADDVLAGTAGTLFPAE